MKRIIATVLVLTFGSCTRIPSDVEAKINAIAKSPGHPWKQWVADVDALLAEIEKMPDSPLKIKCLQHFVDRMSVFDLMDPSICNIETAAGEIIHECVYRIPDSMHYLSGASMEDVWEARLKMIAWMQTQARRLYGDGKLPKGTTRLKSGGLLTLDQGAYRRWSERRNAYRRIVAAYNERLNYAEKNSLIRQMEKLTKSEFQN